MASAYDPDTVWKPFGAFSQAVALGDGQPVFLKGQVSLDAHGSVVGEGDMERQVHQVLLNIETILNCFGGRMSDVVSLDQRTTDIDAFMASGPTRADFFKAPFPVTTTVEVVALYDPRLLIEITAIAEIPRDRFKSPGNGRRFHGR